MNTEQFRNKYIGESLYLISVKVTNASNRTTMDVVPRGVVTKVTEQHMHCNTSTVTVLRDVYDPDKDYTMWTTPPQPLGFAPRAYMYCRREDTDTVKKLLVSAVVTALNSYGNVLRKTLEMNREQQLNAIELQETMAYY